MFGRLWKKIPYGAVTNYTEIAQAIGRPKASRAVGSAIGKNPLLMVIPCHRVLTKAGQLGGYRGGVAMKKSLLDLERK
jgi:O-6-methylguanine DNA methyltransferase